MGADPWDDCTPVPAEELDNEAAHLRYMAEEVRAGRWLVGRDRFGEKHYRITPEGLAALEAERAARA